MPPALYPYDLVFFDLDGTLIETAFEIADAVNDTLIQFGLAPVEQARVDRWIGHGTRELLIQAVALRGGTPADVLRHADSFRQMEVAFGEHYQHRCGTRSRLYPHVRETLHALRERGVKLAVVTNKECRYTQTVLDAHELSPLFDRVISGDTFAVKKPNPLAITDTLSRHGVTAHRALFVGDSSIDVATARNAGVAVWVLPYGYNMGESIEACGPDRVIPDFSALLPQAVPEA
jgi:phosphoglycolate phosphatase